MELREVRVDDLAADETYGMIVNSRGLIQNHRALKRELCLTRAALLCLLFASTAVCILGYFQQIPGFKDKEVRAQANGTRPNVAETLVDVQPSSSSEQFFTTHVGGCDHFANNTEGNVTWSRPQDPQTFRLDRECESLIIPQDGYYKITLQITYGEAEPVKGQINMSHHLKVYTDAYGEPMTPLSVYETVYRDREWSKSVFSEKVLFLYGGDRVTVQTSNLRLVRCEHAEESFLTAQLESQLPKY